MKRAHHTRVKLTDLGNLFFVSHNVRILEALLRDVEASTSPVNTPSPQPCLSGQHVTTYPQDIPSIHRQKFKCAFTPTLANKSEVNEACSLSSCESDPWRRTKRFPVAGYNGSGNSFYLSLLKDSLQNVVK